MTDENITGDAEIDEPTHVVAESTADTDNGPRQAPAPFTLFHTSFWLPSLSEHARARPEARAQGGRTKSRRHWARRPGPPR